jgi:hypothetical protein
MPISELPGDSVPLPAAVEMLGDEPLPELEGCSPTGDFYFVPEDVEEKEPPPAYTHGDFF